MTWLNISLQAADTEGAGRSTGQGNDAGKKKDLVFSLDQVMENLEQFTAHLEQACKLLVPAKRGFHITYLDEECDMCTLTTDTVKDALSCARREGEALCLRLTVAARECVMPVDTAVDQPAEEPQCSLVNVLTPPFLRNEAIGTLRQQAVDAPEAVAGRSYFRMLKREDLQQGFARITQFEEVDQKHEWKNLLENLLDRQEPSSSPPALLKDVELTEMLLSTSPSRATPSSSPFAPSHLELHREPACEDYVEVARQDAYVTLSQEMNQAQAELRAQDERQAVSEQELEDLRFQVDMAQAEAQRSLELATASQREEARAREAEEELRQELQRSTAEICAAMAQLEEAATDATRAALAERSLDAKSRECDGVRQELVLTIAEVMEAQDNASRCQREKVQALAILAEVRDDLQAKKEEAEALQHMVDELKAQAAQKDERLAMQARENELLRETLEAQAQNTSALSAELHEASNAAAEAAEEKAAAAAAMQVAREEASRAKEQEASAAIDCIVPLVMGIEASEARAGGEVSVEFSELLDAHRARAVHHLGAINLAASNTAVAVPICATLSVTNDGKAQWPATTVIAQVAGEACGLPLQAVAPIAPGECEEIVMELLVQPKGESGHALSVWSITDAATGKPLGPLLIFEVFWE